MHHLYERANALTREAIAAAIEVHRILGPGLLEKIYQKCYSHELDLRKIPSIRQDQVLIQYKDISFTEPLCFDVLIDGCLLVELKAAMEVVPINKAQLLSYMKLLDIPLGLIINFHELRLVDGVHRMILPGANLNKS